METNMETRNSSRIEINHFSNNQNGQNSIPSAMRFNGSLPRNFNSTHIPIRNGYFSYSQGKFKDVYIGFTFEEISRIIENDLFSFVNDFVEHSLLMWYALIISGAPTYLSSNDDLRPSTHPVDNAAPVPKRFININKHLGDKSSIDNYSDERTHMHFK